MAEDWIKVGKGLPDKPKMAIVAKKRIKNAKNSKITLPCHTDDSAKKRGKKYSDNLM